MSPLLLTLAVVLTAPAPKTAPKKDPPSLLGEWAIEAATVAGKDKRVPSEALQFTFRADGTVAVQDGNRDPRPVRYKADPKKSPAHLDITPPADSGRPTTTGIYKIDGDTLTICFDQKPGAERPREFASPAGSLLTVFVFKRVQKE